MYILAQVMAEMQMRLAHQPSQPLILRPATELDRGRHRPFDAAPVSMLEFHVHSDGSLQCQLRVAV